MKKLIQTVLGRIKPEKLGFTQCHEHLLLSKGRSFQIHPALWMDEPEKSLKEVLDYKEAGGCTLVEAQPTGCNRVSRGLEEISKASGVHIVASTGFHKLQFYPERHWIHELEERKLSEVFEGELTEGMYIQADQQWRQERHPARAGIIKTALDSCGMIEPYERLFRAAVRAHRNTGAPMMVHIEKESSPERLARTLKEWGADPEKIYFCHMDRACSGREAFLQVLDAGFSLEFDTIGRFKYHSDAFELELFKTFLKLGYENQLLFSLDTTRERLKTYTPEGVGLTYILETFLPAMRESGITERQIEKISVENPARILAW